MRYGCYHGDILPKTVDRMKDLEEKLEMKVKDCYNTNTIFDKRKYVLLSDAKKALNEALSVANVINWVATSDKLPPQEDNVLTYTEKDEIHVGKYGGTFWIVGNQFSFDMGEPTHWAKLPKPPCS